MMRKILIIGAGKSTSYLLDYLLGKAEEEKLEITIGDINPSAIPAAVADHKHCSVIALDIFNQTERTNAISNADIVISMLPARFHIKVAEDCVVHKKHLVTASYVSPELLALDKEVKANNLVFMNEIGLDPGVDHMSAMEVIDRIRDKGGKIILFESFCGGLVAPEHDNNLWNYKFTWNPRNVVLAGGEGARFLHNGKFKYIPHHKVFRRIETIKVPELGVFEVYGNRDSLTYRETYGLHNLDTMFRGTIRRPGFCEAWDIFVQLGATDDTYVMEDTENMTHREFINSFMKYRTDIPVETKLALYLGVDEESEMMDRLRWLGIFENTRIGIPGLTPARILQKILEEKWKLDPGDKDMIVMQHQFDFLLNERHFKRFSTMVFIGKDSEQTAMSMTVGLPLAMVAKQILTGQFNEPGVQLPIIPAIYNPVLEELKEYGIYFVEEESLIS